MLKTFVHLIIISGLFLCGVAFADAGELDAAFGVDGRVSLEFGAYGDRAQAVVIQKDGKILLGGSSTNDESLAVSLFRLLPDGSPDPEFNGDGTVIVDISSADDEILALALSPEGDIIAGGYTGNGTDRDFLLMRFHADGSIDTGFGDHGRVITAVGNSDDEITALVVEKNGAILAAGNAAGTKGRVVVVGRYLTDGRLDPAFGDQGMSLTGVGVDALAQGMVLTGEDHIIVSGSYTDGTRTRLMLVGFTEDGRLDAGFGSDGISTTLNSDEVSEGYGIYQAENGDLYVAGSVGPEGKRAAALFCFTRNGRIDTTFGDNGILVTEIGPEDDVLYSLAGDAESLNAAGFTTTNSNRDFLLITYDRQNNDTSVFAAEQGTKDASLHIGELQVKESLASFTPEPETAEAQLLPAVVTTSFGAGESVSYGLAMQKDGKVVTVGTAGDNGTTSAVVARFGKSTTLKASTGGAVDNNVNITTLPITDIKATGAFSGGNINAALGSVTQRGVVFSIAPYPVCKGDCATGGSGGGFDGGGGDSDGGTDATSPVITNSTPATFTLADPIKLSVTTNENATCKYNKDSDVAFDSMTGTFSGAGGTSHTGDILSLKTPLSYNYFVRCRDSAGNENATGLEITFTVINATSFLPIHSLDSAGRLFVNASESIGNFLVPSARAQEVNNGTTASATTDTTSTSSSLKMLKEGFTNDGGGAGLYSSIMEDLAPDTRYYVRAYAIVNGVTYYGHQILFETSSACFIATAAYGSLLDPAVVILREFRDHYLNTNFLGKKFVTWYYTNSPPLADRIAASPRLRLVTRVLLVPVIGTGWLFLHPLTAGILLFVFGVAAISVRRRLRAHSVAA